MADDLYPDDDMLKPQKPKKDAAPRGGRAKSAISKAPPAIAKAGSTSTVAQRNAPRAPDMLQGMREALALGHDAHWLVPAQRDKVGSGKHPAAPYADRAVHTVADADRLCDEYRPRQGLGSRTGRNGVYGFECDMPADEPGRVACETELRRLLGIEADAPLQPSARSGGGGLHWHVRLPEGERRELHGGVLWKGTGEHEEIRFLGRNGNIVLPPTLHFSGQRYVWGTKKIHEATPALLEAIERTQIEPATDEQIAELEPVVVDFDALPPSLANKLREAGQTADRSVGVYKALCLMRENGRSPGEALWVIRDSGLPFCSKAAEKHDSETRKDVLRVFAKWEAKKAAEASADFASLPSVSHDDDDLAALRLPALPDAALYGVLADIVRAATANSEATRPGVAAATLVHFAARFGRALGLDIGDDRRTLPLYVLLVGTTAKGRKGTSSQFPEQLFASVDVLLAGGWGIEDDGLLAPKEPVESLPLRVATSAASGQALLQLVQDDGEYKHRGKAVFVEGVADKRVLLDMPEFAQVLAVTTQEGSTLSTVLRNAFDGKRLENNAVSNKIVATGGHLCIFGHITAFEFKRRTVDSKHSTEALNGMLNRFVVVFSNRERIVPEPMPVPEPVRQEIAARLAANVHAVFAGQYATHDSRRVHLMRLDSQAQALWREQYPLITAASYASTSVASMMARRELHTKVLAALLAAMNGERLVSAAALRAALEWGQYMADSTQRVFATWEQIKTASELQTDMRQVLDWMARKGRPVSRREVQQAFHKTRLSSDRQHRALMALIESAPPRVRVEGNTFVLVQRGPVGYVG